MFTLFIALAVLATPPPEVVADDLFAKDYATWYKEYERTGYGWVMLGFAECPPCQSIKAKLKKLRAEENGGRNIIYYDFRHPDVKTYKFEDHMKPPLRKGSYPLLLRMERTKDKKNTLTYLQGNTTLEKLKEFLNNQGG